MTSPDVQQLVRINAARVVRYILIIPACLALLLFLPAGTWDWAKGWLFMLVYLVTLALSAAYLWRVNPEIYVARSRFHPGTKRWDAILLCFLLPAMLAELPVAALDDARFHGSSMPWSVVGLGYVLMLAGTGVAVWAQAVNQFFEPSVRIQTDRGHRVIDTGPYALVRHPGYVGALLLFAGTALCLGSWWALIPAGLASLLMLLRTKWEDQTLRAELTGYEQYAHQVRYRLLPGVW